MSEYILKNNVSSVEVTFYTSSQLLTGVVFSSTEE